MSKKATSYDGDPPPVPEPQIPPPVPPVGPYVDQGDGTGSFILLNANRTVEEVRIIELTVITGHKLILSDGEYLHVDENADGQWRYAAAA